MEPQRGPGSRFLDANDTESLTFSDDVAEWRDKSGNGYNLTAQAHSKLVDYLYDNQLKVVRFEEDLLYSNKQLDTSTDDYTMLAIARYASDEPNQKKNQFIISDRKALGRLVLQDQSGICKRGWYSE